MWGLKTKSESNLIRLRESGSFSVAPGDHDVRGWPVIGSDGEKMGKVHDLIFDKVKEKVRYLEIDIDTSFPSVVDKNILVPIGLATLHPEHKMVAVKEINQNRLNDYPQYKGESITRDYEYTVRDYLMNKGKSQSDGVHQAGVTGVGTAYGAHAASDYSDRLSPQREQQLEQAKSKMYSENEYNKVVRERDVAVSQRDKAYEEVNRLKREYEDLQGRFSRLEDQNKSYSSNSDYNNRNDRKLTRESDYSENYRDNKSVSNENEDDFYSNRFFDCDEFQTGQKC